MKMKKNRIWRIFSMILICALLSGVLNRTQVRASVAIAESGKFGAIEWKLDSEGVLTFTGSGEFITSVQGQIPWLNYKEDIKKVVFAMNAVSGGDITNYFSGCINLQSVNNIPQGVQRMQETFKGCTSLVSVGTIPDTVTDMNQVFQNCKKLNQEIVIPKNVKEAMGAFDGCLKLTYTPVIQSNQIKDMSAMFRKTAITTAPRLSTNAENLSYTFSGCEYLKTAPTIPDTVRIMDHTFEECYEMTTAPAIPYEVESMSYTFNYCMSLTTPPYIASQKLKDMSGAFQNCFEMLSAPTIPESVTNMSYTFYNCAELRKGPDIPANVTEMSYCMAYCSNVSGTMTIYTVIETPDNYYRFAGDTSIYQPSDNQAVLGGCGDGLKVNYVKNNEKYVLKYLAYGWNSGAFLNYGSFGPLSLGEMSEQNISSCIIKNLSEYTYTGKVIKPEPELYYSCMKMKKGTDYTLTYKNNLNAGTGVITVEGKGDYTGRKTVEFEIKKATFSEVKCYSYSGEYDGQPHSITVTCDDGATIEYGEEEGQYTTEKCPEYTLPGKYTTYFRVVKANYETYAGSSTITIEPKELSVKTEGYSGEYDGNPHSIQLETEEGATVKYGTKEGEYTTSICPSYINVGRYMIYYEISKTGYTTYTGMRMVIIKRKNIEELPFPAVGAIMKGSSLREAELAFTYNKYGVFFWKTPDMIPEEGVTEQEMVFMPNDILNYDYTGIAGYDEVEQVVVQNISVTVNTPTPPPTPVPTPTPIPIQTVEPTIMPIATLNPTSTPEPIQTSKPIPIPKPIQTTEPIQTPIPTVTVKVETPSLDKEVDFSDDENLTEENELGYLNELIQDLLQEQDSSEVVYNPEISQLFRNATNLSQVNQIANMTNPGKVKIKKVKSGKRKIQISWKKINRASGYQIAYSTKKAMKKNMKTKRVRGLKTSLKWKTKKKCYIKVRAYCERGGKRVYGKWSKVRSARTKKNSNS